jgi:hypothetical protein
MLRYALIALLAFAVVPAIPAHAQSDNYPYSIMKPEPGTRQVRKHRPPRATRPPVDEPQTAEKPTRKRAARGSSSPVYPTKLPAPENLTVRPPRQVATPTPEVIPPPLVVPQTGRVLPNLPGASSTETFQDRAARCSHQAGVYGPSATGDRNAYVGGCIGQ